MQMVSRIGDILPGIAEFPPIIKKDDPFGGTYMGDGVVMTRIWTTHLLRLSSGDMLVTPHLLSLGINEPHNTRLLASLIQPQDVFVDVGANIGYFSVIGAWRAWPGGQVWSFEPHPKLYALLSDNMTINGYEAIAHRHRLALSDRSGTATMRIFEGYEATSTIRDVPDDFVRHTEQQTGRLSRTIEVDVVRLDDIMRDVPEIHVMKIDAEGHEPAVIRGAVEILRRSRNVRIVMEFVPFIMGLPEAAAHLALCRELGFAIYRIETDASLIRHDDDGVLLGIGFSDLFLVRD